MRIPVSSSPSALMARMAGTSSTWATPPPGTMPSSRAARVALRASSTRCFFSLISVSVAAPTLTTATPPASFGQTFLQLFAVEIGIGDLDLGFELVDAGLDLVELAGAVHDGGVVFVDDHFAGAAELRDGGVLEFETHLVGDDFAAGEDGDVFEHALAAIAEAGGLDRDTGEGSAQLVDHESGPRLRLRRLQR